jgi:hypothetical protein
MFGETVLGRGAITNSWTTARFIGILARTKDLPKRAGRPTH